jgi:hypothetical protein
MRPGGQTSKEEMIGAAKERFGANLPFENCEKTATDNIAPDRAVLKHRLAGE